MASNIRVSLDNPYGQVTIPRAHLRTSTDGATVIANPAALNGNDLNPYVAPPAYLVKEADEDGGGGGGRCACCYRCRRRK